MSDEARIAVLEAKDAAKDETLRDIKQYLMKRADQHTELMSELATIKQINVHTQDYQVRCDKERQEMATVMAVNKETTSLEINKMKQKDAYRTGALAAMSACISILFPGLIEWFKKG